MMMMINCILTSDVKFVAKSSHVTAFITVIPTSVTDMNVVYPQAVFNYGIAIVFLNTSVDVHVTQLSGRRDSSPVHSTGRCRIAPHQYRLTFLHRNTIIFICCCINTPQHCSLYYAIQA